jgi:hypothetical protein
MMIPPHQRSLPPFPSSRRRDFAVLAGLILCEQDGGLPSSRSAAGAEWLCERRPREGLASSGRGEATGSRPVGFSLEIDLSRRRLPEYDIVRSGFVGD